jgi:hypothetical protein
MDAYPERIRVVLLRNADWWVAQCLEVDIAVQAKTWADAIRNLEITINSRIAVCQHEGVNPFDLPRAPDSYWTLFNESPEIQLNDSNAVSDFLPGFFEAFQKREVRLSRYT